MSEHPASQICATTRLLTQLGLKPARVPPEAEGLSPLATWYADLFTFNRRQCLMFFNPATGYAVIAPYVTKKRIQSLRTELTNLLVRRLAEDGFSAETVAKCVHALAGAELARTSNRSDRARMVSAIRDAHFLMGQAVQSDPRSVERLASVGLSHRALDPAGAPVAKLGAIVDELVPTQFWLDIKRRDVCRILATIEDVEPKIWRRLVVPSAMRLDEFHLVLQAAFGWTNSHLHMFTAGEHIFEAIMEDFEQDGKDEREFCLADLLDLDKGLAEYMYDYVDSWRHTIRLEERFMAPKRETARCLDGQRACPPEDVGGAPGYARLMGILANPSHEEYESYMEWLPDGYDPEAFTIAAANEGIRRMLEDYCSGNGLISAGGAL